MKRKRSRYMQKRETEEVALSPTEPDGYLDDMLMDSGTGDRCNLAVLDFCCCVCKHQIIAENGNSISLGGCCVRDGVSARGNHSHGWCGLFKQRIPGAKVPVAFTYQPNTTHER